MENILGLSCYGLHQSDKEDILLERFQWLTELHYQNCPAYRSVIDAYGGIKQYKCLEDIPPLAVHLFKTFELASVERSELFKVLSSSGTSSQLTSKIYLDRSTAYLQSKVLVKILQQYIGKQRMPMMIVDHSALIGNKNAFSARGAGVQGLSLFGRDHTYLLNQNMELDVDKLVAFCDQYGDQPVLLFGFTFMVWLYLLKVMEEKNIRVSLPKGILIHSGGWKKMLDEAVDNSFFKKMAHDRLGVTNVHNFYGMVEQTGSIFMECEEGVLHSSVFSDVLIRKSHDWSVCEVGEQGVIQVCSVIPTSYPGHNLLTEDIGMLLGIDDCPCGRKGKYFKVDGRIPQAELRGCSDTFEGTA